MKTGRVLEWLKRLVLKTSGLRDPGARGFESHPFRQKEYVMSYGDDIELSEETIESIRDFEERLRDEIRRIFHEEIVEVQEEFRNRIQELEDRIAELEIETGV